MTDSFIAIRSERLSAEINPLGAELHALRDADGRDLLWDGDPAVWSGRSPVLFPIVGALAGGAYRHAGRTYALPKHGFARRRTFEVVEAAAARATFRLRWDEKTLAVYPFRFELDLTFVIDGATLKTTASVRNLDPETEMFASFGFHPALRWPLPYGQARAEHVITFERDEPAPIRRVNPDGLVTPDAFPTPVIGRELALRDDLFVDDALIFDRIESRRLRYGAAAGPHLEVTFPDTALLGVWTKPGADYICIEPWRGWADPVGYEGDFRDKPGVFSVAPGDVRELVMSIGIVG